ncbi:hypothetical protein [Teredinibacter haidensis]|uniref:hypothetical protein n=1 Tax=Teredinibacter haidensis TaxID=2731755 RepID=UPI00094906A9|nr:hypothetical protein [Teredinibacter haidensis]
MQLLYNQAKYLTTVGALFATLLLGIQPVQSHAASEHCFILRVGGFGSAFSHYEEAIFKLAAKVTEKEYGPCNITSLKTPSSMARVWKELSLGVKFHGSLSAAILPKDHQEEIHQYENSFLEGALGLRQSLVKKTFQSTFEQISDFDQLKHYTVGQGYQWTDVQIYEHMEIPVVASFRINNVFGMLQQDRFHHVPLSILQIKPTYNSVKNTYPQITIANKPFIYYPIRTWAYFNTNDKVKVERFTKGLDHIFNTGQASAVFRELFFDEIDAIKKQNGRVFVLNNPAYSKNENKRLADDFSSTHKLKNHLVWPSSVTSQASASTQQVQ